MGNFSEEQNRLLDAIRKMEADGVPEDKIRQVVEYAKQKNPSLVSGKAKQQPAFSLAPPPEPKMKGALGAIEAQGIEVPTKPSGETMPDIGKEESRLGFIGRSLKDFATKEAPRGLGMAGSFIAPYGMSPAGQAARLEAAVEIEEVNKQRRQDYPKLSTKPATDVFSNPTDLDAWTAAASTIMPTAAAMITAPLTGGGSAVALTGAYFGSSLANSYTEGVKSGLDENQSMLYGTVMGSIEAAAENLGLDALTKIPKSWLSKTVKESVKKYGKEGAEKTLKESMKAITAWLAKRGIGAAQGAIVEGAEEGLTSLGQSGTQLAFDAETGSELFDPNKQVPQGGVVSEVLSRALEAGAGGAIGGGLIGGVRGIETRDNKKAVSPAAPPASPDAQIDETDLEAFSEPPISPDEIAAKRADIERRRQEDPSVERGVLINYESGKTKEQLIDIVNKLRNGEITFNEIVNEFWKTGANTISEVKEAFNDGTLADKIQFGLDVKELSDLHPKTKSRESIISAKQKALYEKQKAESALKDSEYKIVKKKESITGKVTETKIKRTAEEKAKYEDYHKKALEYANKKIEEYDAELAALEKSILTEPTAPPIDPTAPVEPVSEPLDPNTPEGAADIATEVLTQKADELDEDLAALSQLDEEVVTDEVDRVEKALQGYRETEEFDEEQLEAMRPFFQEIYNLDDELAAITSKEAKDSLGILKKKYSQRKKDIGKRRKEIDKAISDIAEGNFARASTAAVVEEDLPELMADLADVAMPVVAAEPEPVMGEAVTEEVVTPTEVVTQEEVVAPTEVAEKEEKVVKALRVNGVFYIDENGDVSKELRDKLDKAKSEKNLEELDDIYNSVRVVLNGPSQARGQKTVEQFQAIKSELEDFANQLKQSKKKDEKEPVLEGVQGRRDEGEGRKESPELRTEEAKQEEVVPPLAEEAKADGGGSNTPTISDFEAISAKGEKGRKARAELTKRLGKDTVNDMTRITANFESIINNLENQGKIRKECP